LTGHTNRVRSVSFNYDGQLIASCSDDKTIKIWCTKSGVCLKTFSQETRIRSVSFNLNTNYTSTIVSGGDDNLIKIWDVESGKCLKKLPGHNNIIHSVVFNKNNKLPLIASGSDDRTVKIWNFSTGKCLKTLLGHTSRVRSVSFSNDGKWLASSSEDETICLWSLNSDLIDERTTVSPIIFRSPRPYEDLNIYEIKGLTRPEIDSLILLGAIEKQ
jgi:WD40 repeat protein